MIQPNTPPSSVASPRRLPLWMVALGTTLGMQSVASFIDQSLPTIAPLVTAEAGLAPESIGKISSLTSLGVVLFLLFGIPLLVRLGPVRSLQLGTLTAAAGLAMASTGHWLLLGLGAILMGVGYGPSPPSGSRILAATAPPRHRTLIFSIKQAGAPAGGAMAGLILAPVASAWGGSLAVLVSIGIALVAVVLVNPCRRDLNIERAAAQPVDWRTMLNPHTVIRPFRLLVRRRAIFMVTLLAFSFAAVQGSLFSFSVTYLVAGLHLSLKQAGLAYAALQCAGVVARIFLGWLADRTGRPAVNLTVQAFFAAASVCAFASLPAQPPLWLAALVCAATGFLAASWNGIYMAEVARASTSEEIIEVTSSSTVVTFMGYVVGPALSSALVTLSGGWRASFLVIAAQLVVMAACHAVTLVRPWRRG